jgi:hypothetical protein
VLPDSFSAVLRVSGLVFMFCSPGLVLAVPRASGRVFMFCAPRLVFGETEGVESRFHFLHSRTRFQRYRGPRVPFSCFMLLDSFSTLPSASGRVFMIFSPDSFSAVPWASGPVFTFCALGIIFDGTEGVRSRFLILRVRTRFRRYRGCRVPFSHLRFRTHFRRYRGRRVPFSCLRARTHFRRNRGRRVPFSFFALPDSFSALPSASGLVFMFCSPGLVFGDTEGVESRFHFLRCPTRFSRYRRRRVPFSRFPLPDSFSAIPRASGPVF